MRAICSRGQHWPPILIHGHVHQNFAWSCVVRRCSGGEPEDGGREARCAVGHVMLVLEAGCCQSAAGRGHSSDGGWHSIADSSQRQCGERAVTRGSLRVPTKLWPGIGSRRPRSPLRGGATRKSRCATGSTTCHSAGWERAGDSTPGRRLTTIIAGCSRDESQTTQPLSTSAGCGRAHQWHSSACAGNSLVHGGVAASASNPHASSLYTLSSLPGHSPPPIRRRVLQQRQPHHNSWPALRSRRRRSLHQPAHRSWQHHCSRVHPITSSAKPGRQAEAIGQGQAMFPALCLPQLCLPPALTVSDCCCLLCSPAAWCDRVKSL